MERHRGIAQLLEDMRKLDSDETLSTPLKQRYNGVTPTKIKKSERKILKNAAKASARPKVITQEEIRRIGNIVHSKSAEDSDAKPALKDDTELQRDLTFVPNIHGFQERARKANAGATPDFAERAAEVIHELGVHIDKRNQPKERKTILDKLAQSIREDLRLVYLEEIETMKRKAGYWRFVSRRTYNKMVANQEVSCSLRFTGAQYD